MEKETIKRIFQKYKEGTASPDEIRILHSYYIHKAKNSVETLDDHHLQENLDELETRLFPKKVKSISFWKYAAAAIILICSGTAIFQYRQHTLFDEAAQPSAQLLSTIAPGHNQATLRMPDGQVINIDRLGKLINKDGAILLDQGTIDLNGINSNQLITVETPRGGQFQFQLQDGTQVWLNAGSTISYPAKFANHERSVILKGEAYFEVAHNPDKPFKVKVANDEVQVLGTGFNVQSYTDNMTPITTLVHGKVKVTRKSKGENQSLILQPGQQTLSNANLQKANTNINSIIAWKNGLFSFKRSSVKAIVRELERWYNIDFIIAPEIAENRLITGEIPRNVNLDDVMEILSYFDIQAQLKNNKVYLTLKKQ